MSGPGQPLIAADGRRPPVSHRIDRFGVVFDEGSLVAGAGLLAAGPLMSRLGVEEAVDASVRLDGRPGGFSPPSGAGRIAVPPPTAEEAAHSRPPGGTAGQRLQQSTALI